MSDQDPVTEYSGEEMLKVARAKSGSGGSESREVVVQDDGTKVVRVKRRRRKNNKLDLEANKQEEQRFHLKLLLWFVIGSIVLAAIVSGVIFFRVISLSSPKEITQIQQRVQKELDAEVSIKGYRVGAKKAIVQNLSVNSADGSSVLIRNIEIPLKPELILLGKLDGDKASASYSLFKLDSTFFNNEGFSGASLGLPYSHDSLFVSDANLIWGNKGREKSSFTIKNAEGKYSVREDQTVQAIFRKGIIENSGALPPRLESATFVFSKDAVTVQSLLFSDGEVGRLSIKGEYLKGQSGTQELECFMDKMKLENLNLHLRTLLEARLTSSKTGECVINTDEPNFSISTYFQASESGFVMKNFQFLHDISSQIGSLPDASVSFAKLSRGKVEMTKEGYRFSDLNFESISNLALMGEFSISINGEVSGELSVGLPVSKIKQAYPEIDDVDFEVARGFVWVPATLSGAVALPKDDFMKNFKKGVLKR